MKKTLFIIFTLITVLLPAKSWADGSVELGAPAKCWTFPRIYTMDEPVTWYFDMTDAGFDEGVDLYMWTWSPSEPDAGNWENSSDFAKLEYVGDNVYKTTIVPLDYYRRANPNLTVADIEGSAGFWMRLKTKNGAYQSAVFSMTWSVSELKDFKESGEAATAYPAKFAMDDYGKTSNEVQTIVAGAYATLRGYGSATPEGNGVNCYPTCEYVFFLNECASDEACIPTRGTDWYDGGRYQQMQYHTWDAQNQMILSA